MAKYNKRKIRMNSIDIKELLVNFEKSRKNLLAVIIFTVINMILLLY